jgi:hypothetical protein
VDVFTTNYDINIETAYDEVVAGNADLYFGINGQRRKFLDMKLWQNTDSLDHGLVTKLHGSLDWKLDGNRICVGDAVFTGDHAKHAIIYPGFKGESEISFFRPFHDYLERSLANSDVLIFIGFAFRDEYINNSIRNNLSPSAEVIIINPDASVKFPHNRAKAKYIRSGFDRLSVGTVLEIIHQKQRSRRT